MRDVYVVGGQNLYLPPRDITSSYASSSALTSSSSTLNLPSPAVAADALVTTRFLGYLKIWRATNRIFDSVHLHLPDVQLRTRAAFCRVPASAAARCRDELGSSSGGGGGGGKNGGLPELREGLHAACHALCSAAPAILGCDASDLGTECDSPYDSRFRPMRLLLWEKNGSGSCNGGGLAERAADAFGELLAAALDIVSGCPSCCSSSSSSSSAPPVSRKSANGNGSRNGNGHGSGNGGGNAGGNGGGNGDGHGNANGGGNGGGGSDGPGCPQCTFWSGCSEYNAVLHRGAARIVLEETMRAAAAAAAAAAFGGGGGDGGGAGGGGVLV